MSKGSRTSSLLHWRQPEEWPISPITWKPQKAGEALAQRQCRGLQTGYKPTTLLRRGTGSAESGHLDKHDNGLLCFKKLVFSLW